MNRIDNAMRLLAVLALCAAGACTYYETAPGVYQTSAPSKFDRAWAAATGAFQDQGVSITAQDRDAGYLSGTRDGIEVIATIRTQADGSVRVQFDTRGDTNRDPELIHRIDRAYDRLMGR
jgi:hypothetical protein